MSSFFTVILFTVRTPPGYYVPKNQRTVISPDFIRCPKGSYQHQPGQSQCYPCPQEVSQECGTSTFAFILSCTPANLTILQTFISAFPYSLNTPLLWNLCFDYRTNSCKAPCKILFMEVAILQRKFSKARIAVCIDSFFLFFRIWWKLL